MPTRIDGEEWLDQGRGTPEAIDRSLADLGRINRWLGGMRGLASYLYPRIRRCRTDRVRVLDLGAGGCTIPEAMARWARHAAYLTTNLCARPSPRTSAVGAEELADLA